MANNLNERFIDAQYRAAAAAYAEKHKHDAEKSEPETEMQMMARAMGLPANARSFYPVSKSDSAVNRLGHAFFEE